MQLDSDFLTGLLIVPVATAVLVALVRWLVVTTPEGHALVQLRMGELVRTITTPGPAGAVRIPLFDRWILVSQQWHERILRGVESNDAQGTSVQIDLRVTFRIADPARALFGVTDWEEALESATVHEAAARLAGKDRADFLSCAPSLSTALTAALRESLAEYGLEVGHVRIANVQLRPEVARQMFEAVAAKLQVARATYEEQGRTDAALLLAQTEQQVAVLEARAKTESLKAVGRAYRVLQQQPAVHAAFAELYGLGQLDPARVVSLAGFGDAAPAPSGAALVEADLGQAALRPSAPAIRPVAHAARH